MKVISLDNDRKLIAGAVKNDRRAQHQLYQKHSGKMLSVCRMYIKDTQEAEAVMLQGFYKVFTRIKDFKNTGRFDGWVRKIMVREAISHLRGKKAVVWEGEEALARQGTDDIGPKLGAAHIQRLIDELPEGYRAVFVLYAIEGYRHNEIAELLQINPGTSKSQLNRARQLLRQKLGASKKQKNDRA